MKAHRALHATAGCWDMLEAWGVFLGKGRGKITTWLYCYVMQISV